jgi:hypothetical protein
MTICCDEVIDYVYRVVTKSGAVTRRHNGRAISDPNELTIYEAGLRDNVLHQGRRLFISDNLAWKRLTTLHEALRRLRDSRGPKGMTCFQIHRRESYLYSRNHPA